MSIFGPSWISGDQITRTKQANMVADGINIVDDIHPQYLPVFYDWSSSFLLDEPAGGTELLRYKKDDFLTPWASIKLGAIRNYLIYRSGIKFLPSFQASNINFEYKGAKSAAPAAGSFFYEAFDDGVSIGNGTDNIAAIHPAYDSFTHQISLAGVAANSILDINLIFRITSAVGTDVRAKEIKIYFS